MRRWTAVLLLLLMLPWQSIAWAAGALGAGELVGDAMHATTHWVGDAHHHAHDGGLHEDDSDESVAHLVHTDAHASVLTLVGMPIEWAAPEPSGATRPEHGVGSLAGPFLEGPRRPPKAAC